MKDAKGRRPSTSISRQRDEYDETASKVGRDPVPIPSQQSR
ncbi:hypothetical protein COLO4_13105 [Corchorus olitorius]|uniref:Uncharacterized protein n=1 Tax=Corchorus olitorius TaxID=93759 RepID=A0A1R3JY53_9ROSI|nr:hypothetical protein COLO4_13105 [Corchorus olitorius]